MPTNHMMMMMMMSDIKYILKVITTVIYNLALFIPQCKSYDLIEYPPFILKNLELIRVNILMLDLPRTSQT